MMYRRIQWDYQWVSLNMFRFYQICSLLAFTEPEVEQCNACSPLSEQLWVPLEILYEIC